MISTKSSAERKDHKEDEKETQKIEQKRIVYLKSSASKFNEVKSRNIISNGMDKVYISQISTENAKNN